jgi:hypothetical protein
MTAASARAFSARTTDEIAYQAPCAARLRLATFFRLRCRLVVSSNGTCLIDTAKTLFKQKTISCELVLLGKLLHHIGQEADAPQIRLQGAGAKSGPDVPALGRVEVAIRVANQS